MDVDARMHSGHEAALLRLFGELHRASPHHDTLDLRPALIRAGFLDEYCPRHRAVVLPGVLGYSEALRS
ncbi:MAG: hypothetical protein H0V64_04450 [Geodermatophilaceae bacterium]|nr:hypothetical protein [Geodermatophilaceae bacterium]